MHGALQSLQPDLLLLNRQERVCLHVDDQAASQWAPSQGNPSVLCYIRAVRICIEAVWLLARAEQGKIAEACRFKLGDALPANFFDFVRDKQIAATLITRPPKNLFVQDEGQAQFGEQVATLASTAQLLNAVWQVRNNLFHGNKMYPADRERDAALMANALAVIDAILQQEPNVSSAFHEPQQFF